MAPTDALDVTVTLDDVFAVVHGKRVPLAPELAGYLALEIAENSDAKSGDVDPKSVYIAEEGTVVLVKPKREGAGSADASIRAILARLLEASGSQTPALASAARRRATGNMRALIEELEAALIPVNRAAGRRALARLAREVKRVTLGVGRNAQVPPSTRGPSASQPSVPAGPTPLPPVRPPPLAETPHAPPPQPPPKPFAPEAPTRRREVQADPRMLPTPYPFPAASPSHGPPGDVRRPPPPPAAPADVDRSLAPPTPLPLPEPPAVVPSPLGDATKQRALSPDDVDNLLANFDVSNERSDQAVARDLKAMVGLEPTPPPPAQGALLPRVALPGAAADAGVESLLAMSEPVAIRGAASPLRSQPTPSPSEPPPKPEIRTVRPSFHGTLPGLQDSGPELRARPAGSHAQPPTAPPLPVRPPPPPPAPPPAREANTGPSQLAQARAPSVRVSTAGEMARIKPKGGSGIFIVLGLLFVAVIAAAVWMIRLPPGFLTGRTPDKIAQEKADYEATKEKIAKDQAASACRATLDVTEVPAGAEVLLRVGQAPVDIDHMPVGARLEFVATAEGYAPKRTVVPAGQLWKPGANGKPLFELAVQLEKSTKPKGDLWPAGEAGSQVGGQGPPGTVHVVSAPPGAEIWLLAGIGPEARIEQLIPCGEGADVLLAGPTTFRKRLRVEAKDFAADPSGAPVKMARVSAK